MLHAPGELLDALTRAHSTRWTHADELLALAVEKLDELSILMVQLWTKNPGQARKPFRYRRPIVKAATTSPMSEIRRFFGRR